MALSFTVTAFYDGWCVRDYLRTQGVSSTALRRAKRTPPGILADGTPVFTNALVHTGMRLVLPEVQEASPTLQAQAIPLQVRWENEDAAVVEKPAGMAVHPTLNHSSGTLANAWMGLLAQRGESGAFHPVWRLDKDTSGLVLLAKRGDVQPFLERSCSKLYAAVLTGTPSAASGVCRVPIARASDSIILRQASDQGQSACTAWRVLESNGRYSLTVFRLLTGRTHQIRVHMSHLGCPLAGDDLYGGKKTEAFPRQALHCAAAAFCLPDGRTVRVVSPFPTDILEQAGLPQAESQLAAFCEKLEPTPENIDGNALLSAFFEI